MPGWSIATLPTGFAAKRVADAAAQTCKEWYVVKGYGYVSKNLCTDSQTFQADLDSFVDGHLPASYGLSHESSLLQMRNRWLAQTDPYLLQPATFPQDMPGEVQTAITGNLAAIETWRQSLRDYPGTVTDWTRPPALPSPPAILLPSGRQLIIVT